MFLERLVQGVISLQIGEKGKRDSTARTSVEKTVCIIQRQGTQLGQFIRTAQKMKS